MLPFWATGKAVDPIVDNRVYQTLKELAKSRYEEWRRWLIWSVEGLEEQNQICDGLKYILVSRDRATPKEVKGGFGALVGCNADKVLVEDCGGFLQLPFVFCRIGSDGGERQEVEVLANHAHFLLKGLS
jgi:hypothetical protein